MQIVINMPSKEFEHFKQFKGKFICDNGYDLIQAIKNGTPLPKGHGELVDIRPLMRGLYEEKCVGEVTYTTSEVYKMLDDETTTIIEAENEESEDN